MSELNDLGQGYLLGQILETYCETAVEMMCLKQAQAPSMSEIS